MHIHALGWQASRPSQLASDFRQAEYSPTFTTGPRDDLVEDIDRQRPDAMVKDFILHRTMAHARNSSFNLGNSPMQSSQVGSIASSKNPTTFCEPRTRCSKNSLARDESYSPTTNAGGLLSKARFSAENAWRKSARYSRPIRFCDGIESSWRRNGITATVAAAQLRDLECGK